MKIVIAFLIILLVSCNSHDLKQFSIVSPSANNTLWAKHTNLPKFNSKLHSDGCSGGMSTIYAQLKFLHKKHGKILQWRQCCEVHDKAYYYGGKQLDKTNADVQLKQCVNKVIGNEFLGKAMQIAVKVGGGPYLPTPYRWGYGEDYRKKQ